MIAVISDWAMMTSITIRNLDERLKRKLRVRAAERNRSMEEEARDILRRALAEEPNLRGNLADAIRELIEPLGGADLSPISRRPICEPSDGA
jgi:antitoxin FitA